MPIPRYKVMWILNPLSFDSLAVVMIANGENYNESGAYTAFYVDQFLTPLELLDNGYLYNTSLPPSERIRVGARSFRASLEDGDEFVIGLADSLGQAIFDLMAEDDEVFSSTTDFFGIHWWIYRLCP